MQRARLFLSAFALTLVSAAAHAATTTYTSSSSFLSQVAAGAYTETFTGLSNPASGAFAGGGFAYTVSAPSDIYASGTFVGTSQIDETLTITFTGRTVTALGANFFASNLSDDFQSVPITLTLSDGTTTSFTPASMADSYRGFVSTVGISSITIGAPGQSLYSGLDNFTVGMAAAVPEPASWALMGLGVAGLLAARRRPAA